ncbi:helix-turn-helix domain-containing protein [Alloyangia pacifica]|uniref:helix-turn-helix domain-containing protein n=1 Tax=Alloyangia pacifica TaxID=311180 RepID=UPI001CD728FB|nr:helix-turn-helix domain-containing protein [Alloyangia pacifica]MCA0994417.1 helix-turn-helix domain-containing protein [Alloyangia pacifica]
METLCQTRLALLGNPLRLRLVRLLIRHLPHPLPAGALASALGVPGSTLSAHLAALCEAGLLVQRVRGPLRLYHAVPAALGQVVDWLAADVALGRLSELDAPLQGLTRGQDRGRCAVSLPRVLFLCRDGAQLSPLAAALAQRRLWGQAVWISAGVQPAGRVDPLLAAVLQAQGMPPAEPPRPMQAFAPAQVVIALDSAAAEALPGVLRSVPPVCAYWPLPVPQSETGERVIPRAVALDAALRALAPRLDGLRAVPLAQLPRGALQAALDSLSSGLPEVCRAAASVPPPRRRWSSPALRASAAS